MELNRSKNQESRRFSETHPVWQRARTTTQRMTIPAFLPVRLAKSAAGTQKLVQRQPEYDTIIMRNRPQLPSGAAGRKEAMGMRRIGVDLGGTSAKLGVVNEQNEIIERRVIPTDRTRSFDTRFSGLCLSCSMFSMLHALAVHGFRRGGVWEV